MICKNCGHGITKGIQKDLQGKGGYLHRMSIQEAFIMFETIKCNRSVDKGKEHGTTGYVCGCTTPEPEVKR